MNNFLKAGLLTTVAASCLVADVTYTKSMKYTGGTMLDLVRSMASNPMMGRMAASGMGLALPDQTYTVYLKGSKMAQIGQPISTIFDLDAGAITIINSEKRTYSVQTFDHLREQMEHAQAAVSRGKTPTLSFDVKVENTGESRTINGQSANQTVITLTSQTDSSSGRAIVKVTVWMIPVDSNTRELHEFSKRIAEKMSLAMLSMSPMLGGAGTALSSAMHQVQQLEGIPVLDDTNVTGIAFPPTAARGGNRDPNAPLISVENQYFNFSSGPVDDSKFAVPAGYQQEQQR